MGILRYREDAMVGLCGQTHAAVLEPLPGILRTECAEQTPHQSVTTWINLFQVADAVEGVRHVAAPSTTYRHFA